MAGTSAVAGNVCPLAGLVHACRGSAVGLRDMIGRICGDPPGRTAASSQAAADRAEILALRLR